MSNAIEQRKKALALPPIARRVSALEHTVILHTSKITKLEDLYVLIAQKVDNIADAVRYGNDCNERIVSELGGTRADISNLSDLIAAHLRDEKKG